MKKGIVLLLITVFLLSQAGVASAKSIDDYINPKDWGKHSDLTKGGTEINTDGTGRVVRPDDPKNVVIVFLDEISITFPDMQAYVKNGRTLVPVRFVAKELKGTVDWNDSEQKVTITKGDKVIVLKIGEKMATVNGKPVYFDVPAEIERGRTMVPLRFISETLDVRVEWHEVNKWVMLYTK